jgi:hypothetical protein
MSQVFSLSQPEFTSHILKSGVWLEDNSTSSVSAFQMAAAWLSKSQGHSSPAPPMILPPN